MASCSAEVRPEDLFRDVTAEKQTETAPEELIPTRASLLERLRLWSDNVSWQEFFDTYWRLIYRTARSAGLTASEAEETVQETIISVAKHMPGFRYRTAADGGSFKAWLLKMTKWRIMDQLRRRKMQGQCVPLENDDGEAREIPDGLSHLLDAQWETDWERNLLDAALERLKQNVEPKHYQIYQWYVLKNKSALQVSRDLGVSLAQVYTIKHRVGKELLQILATLRRAEETP